MSLITRYVDQDDLGNGILRNTINLRPVGYRRAEALLRSVHDLVDSGDGALPHQVQRAPLRVLATNDGMRRMFPLPDDDGKYLEIGAPWIQIGGVWTQVSLGIPDRSANKMTWTRPQTITKLTHGGHFVKIEIELRSGFVPENSRVAFPVGINGLTRSGVNILDNGNVVAVLRPFVMYDASNPDDIRPITHQFANLSGQPYLLLTLPDLTGMGRPVIDPAISLQPDATDGTDTYIRSDTATTNFGTNTSLIIGEMNSSVSTRRTLIKFDLSSLSSDAIISSAILSMFALVDASDNARTFRVFRQKRDWSEAQSTWNIYSTGNNWTAAGGFHSDDSEQTDIGSRAFSAADGTNVFKDFTLSPVAKGALDMGYGWIIKADIESDDAYTFASSDNATAANRPKLAITYTLPGAAGRSFFVAPFTPPFGGLFG